MEAFHHPDMCPMAASKLYTSPKLSTWAKIPFVYIGIMTALENRLEEHHSKIPG